MKKLVLALAALVAFGGSALAADLPARTYAKAPAMPEPVYNWTGFYVSGGGGAGFWDADNSTFLTRGGFPQIGNQRQGGDGWFGTVGAGYDWQFNQSWVAGIFADGQFGSLKGSITGVEAGEAVTGSLKLQDSWAAGVRLGWLVVPSVLTYVNFGFTQSFWSGSQLAPLATTPLIALSPIGVPNALTPSFNHGGWFIGGGVENNLNIFGIQAPGWFMKTEYRAAFFKTFNVDELNIAGTGPLPFTISFKPAVQTISTSLGYRFNSPVVAKY
jgi:outer membrane immunogenic protein